GDGRSSNDVGGDHQSATLQAVGEDAGDHDEQHVRQGHREEDDRERGRGVGELVGLPRQRDEKDAVAQEGHGHPGPEERKVADPERPQDPEAAKQPARRQAPRPPKMENGFSGATSQTISPPAWTSTRAPPGASSRSRSASARASSSLTAPTRR